MYILNLIAVRWIISETELNPNMGCFIQLSNNMFCCLIAGELGDFNPKIMVDCSYVSEFRFIPDQVWFASSNFEAYFINFHIYCSSCCVSNIHDCLCFQYCKLTIPSVFTTGWKFAVSLKTIVTYYYYFISHIWLIGLNCSTVHTN